MALIEPVIYQQQRKYPASMDRYMLENLLLQPGVTGGTAMKVSPAGGSYQVNVAAGNAWVQGDGTRMGYYQVTNDATDNYGIAVAHATLPRIDQLVLTVRDASDLGDSTNTPQFQVLQGTATSGATLDNRTGSAALPANSIRLADILVPAANTPFTGTLVAGTHIRDRRPWAYGASWYNSRTAGNISTSSTTYIDISGFTTRMECSGMWPVRATFLCSLSRTTATANQNAFAQVVMDGVSQGTRASSQFVATGFHTQMPLDLIFEPTAGSHLIKFQVRVGGESFNFHADSNYPMVASVRELVGHERIGLSNGTA